MLDRLSRSLSLRLLAIFMALAALFAYGASIAVRWLYSEDDLRELISGHLSLHVDYVSADIGDPPRIDRALAITEKVPVDIRITGPGLDWSSDPDFPAARDLQFGASDIFSEDPEAWLNKLSDVEFAAQGNHSFLKIDRGDYDIIVSSPRIADDPSGPDYTSIIIGIGLLWLLIAYLSVRRLFLPIESIRKGAARIGEGDFSHRIVNYRNDELGDLAHDINKLADDVKKMLEAKHQLLLGISHELRSPMSRLRLEIEMLPDSEARSELQGEVREMEHILQVLIEAERLNTRHAGLQRRPTSIQTLVTDLISQFFASSASEINLDIQPLDLVADIDPTRTALLIKNLLSNAIRHSRQQAGPITVRIRKEGEFLRIEVEDTGPGFSAEEADAIGTPFYRGDASRTRETGGTGLGLYLCRLIAEAHGGRLFLNRDYTLGASVIAELRAERPIS
jgi:signal transduction histidine kinase